jgi:hypothetical protein
MEFGTADSRIKAAKTRKDNDQKVGEAKAFEKVLASRNAWLKVMVTDSTLVSMNPFGSLFLAVTDQMSEELTSTSAITLCKDVLASMVSRVIEVERCPWNNRLSSPQQAEYLIHIATLKTVAIVVHGLHSTFVVTPWKLPRPSASNKGYKKKVGAMEELRGTMPDSKLRKKMVALRYDKEVIQTFFNDAEDSIEIPSKVIHIAYDGVSHYDSVRMLGDDGAGTPQVLPVKFSYLDRGQTVVAVFKLIRNPRSRPDRNRQDEDNEESTAALEPSKFVLDVDNEESISNIAFPKKVTIKAYSGTPHSTS